MLHHHSAAHTLIFGGYRTPFLIACLSFILGCSGSLTGAGLVDEDLQESALPHAHVNCDVPDPDPDCGAGGSDGAGTGATTMSYLAPPLVMGSYKAFPYALIGNSPWTYQMSASFLGNGSVIGDAVWGTGSPQSFNLTSGSTFMINTTGGAGAPSIRAKSSVPIHILTVSFICSNCGN